MTRRYWPLILVLASAWGASYLFIKVAVVTYLIPCFALAYGALILDESIEVAALGGLALILVGVALGSGGVRPRRARAEAVSPAR